MSADQSSGAAQDSGAAQQFAIQKIYIKDSSFEAPGTPESFKHKWEPKVNLELHTDGRGLAEDTYEVVLSLTVTVTNQDATAFLVEVQQAGIFHMKGFKDGELEAMLGSFCPNILFPYAREAVSDTVTRGGFPQLLLAPVNFDALFAQHRAKRQQKQDESDKPVH
ncbi:MAG: preprotein translocase subunit SecB [Gammaproteobacteria bacterium SG8_47]|nr:MAG: preprotein translocase subunit SecB [Gammaproteobacteria bacterium SG8_47]